LLFIKASLDVSRHSMLQDRALAMIAFQYVGPIGHRLTCSECFGDGPWYTVNRWSWATVRIFVLCAYIE
jgi:hypothetical protein